MTKSDLASLCDGLNNYTIKTHKPWNKINCRLNHGDRISWYYKDEEKFWKEEGLEPQKYTSWSGIVVSKPVSEGGRGALDFSDAVVICDRQPCEKFNPDVFLGCFTKIN